MTRSHWSGTLVFLILAPLSRCLHGQTSDNGETITAGDLVLSFDQNGAITGLVDAVGGIDYSVERDHTSLVGLVTATGEILKPDRFKFEDGRYQYRIVEGISVEVKADATPDYITYEVVDFQNNSQQEIAALFWRIDSSLHDTVAESAGIIYDDSFALRPYYEVGRFEPEKAAETRYLARRMGVRFIYGDGAFANFQGDFRFKCFENSYADFKQQIADPAAREGLLIGAHNLNSPTMWCAID